MQSILNSKHRALVRACARTVGGRAVPKHHDPRTPASIKCVPLHQKSRRRSFKVNRTAIRTRRVFSTGVKVGVYDRVVAVDGADDDVGCAVKKELLRRVAQEYGRHQVHVGGAEKDAVPAATGDRV